MATKALNYTTAEINQRLNLAGTAVQPNALNDYYIKTEVDGKVVIDLSTRYNTSYANLSAALAALNSDVATDASAIKKAGVSVKFINSTTNKYEQWNLKASSWSVNTSDWALDVDGSVANNKLKLPFELEKPSSNEYVTQSSQIGHNGEPLDQALGDLSKLDNISKQSTESEEEAIIYETDGGVQVGKIDSTGADFINLKRGGQQVARMSDLPTVPTLDTTIGDNPSNSHTPSTKAVKDYVDDNIPEVLDYPIETETAQSETEEVIVGNDEGTQQYVKVSSEGIRAVAYHDMQGNNVIPVKDTSIGENPSQTNVPTSKAVVDYVRAHGGSNPHISEETTEDSSEEVIFGNNENTDTYIKIGNYGLRTKGLFDLQGNPLIGYTHSAVSLDIEVEVDYNNPFVINDTTQASNASYSPNIYTNMSYFSAPAGNTMCKLVLICGGGGARAKEDAFSYMHIGQILNSLGYAVLAVTGWSREWAHEHGMYAWGDSHDDGGYYYINDSEEKIYLSANVAPIGNWTCIEEARKAYDYVINHYSWVDKSGVYLYGESQGGMVIENIAEMSGIPVKATILDVPAISMQYGQMYISSRNKAIYEFYGLQNHVFDKEKCIGCDPFTRGMDSDIVMDESGTRPTAVISEITAKKFRNCQSPLLMLSGINDTIISTYVHQAYVKALRNNSFPVELKIFNVGHGIVQYTDVVGTIGGYEARAGLTHVLDFMKRYDGYSFTLITN